MLISSLDNSKIKEIVKLKDKKYRDETSYFVVETDKLIYEAYKKNMLIEIYKQEDYNIDIDVITYDVTPKVMCKISNLENSKVLGICKKNDGFLSGTKYLLLDEIQDPANLGAILRNALAFNIDTVILSLNTCDLYNHKTIMASVGSLFHLNIIRDDLTKIINELKSNNIKIIGTTLEGNDIKNINIKDNYAIILGNEGNGMHNDIKELCNDLITIKTNNKLESLNVSSASAIILYELNR